MTTDAAPGLPSPSPSLLGQRRRFERHSKVPKPLRERLTLDLHEEDVNALFRVYSSYYGCANRDHRFKAFCESVMLSAIEFEQRLISERNVEVDAWISAIKGATHELEP